MQIHGLGYIHGSGRVDGPQSIKAPHQSVAAEPEMPCTAQADQIDISPEAEFVARASELPEMRSDRVDDIRAQIAAGRYETDEKLEIAVGRLLNEIG
jgi:anti-sigma28 factor (negative regulator of flagellin synthesis)